MTTSPPPEAEASGPSYIDYETFLSPSFSAPEFANTLVLGTNNPTDTPLDLSTPLSRVLFDFQEVDSHIHALTTASALPLLKHTQEQTAASSHILAELDSQVAALNDSYKRLEKEVIDRYEAAEEVRLVSERLWHTVRLGRAVGRALQLGRQLEVQLAELNSTSNVSTSTTSSSKARDDHRAMIRASNTLLATRALFAATGPGEEGEHLSKVKAVTTLRNDLLNPSERLIRTKSQQIIREFSMSSLSPSASSTSTTYAQTEETKSRTISALSTLYLLSPLPPKTAKPSSRPPPFLPDLLISSLQDYLRTSLTSSLASLSRALGTLPTLDRTLLEISARCQNIVALELLLESTKPPPLPFPLPPHSSAETLSLPPNFLQPLLQTLETSSLPSYFWRSLASALAPRVVELVNRGGVQARTLRTNRNSVRDAIRECVIRGSEAPSGVTVGRDRKRSLGAEAWDREVGVMVGAVIGALGK